MQDQAAALEIEQQILGATTQLEDTLTGRQLRQVALDAPAQPRLAHDDLLDDVTGHRRCNAATGRLDFG